ncbi:MAG: flagellar motor protein MotB [Betaproteobacteria bacterium]
MSAVKNPIIVRKVKGGGSGGGHGSAAWKIAYADFVTAMMAFFLLMWLLGSTAKGDLSGIAEYFQTPLKVALAGGDGSGDSSSVLKGGGMDLSRANGQIKRGDKPPERKTINLRAARAEIERIELARLGELNRRIGAAIDGNPTLRNFKNQLKIELTPDGLRIQIVDQQNRPMFDIGSATLKPYTAEILMELAKLINEVPHKITLAGHTDAAKYSGGERGYSNWELSADRANASRRQLVAGGLAEDKILRVMGVADASPVDAENPLSASNRRISILVLNTGGQERALGTAPPSDTEPASPAIADAAPAGPQSVPAALPAVAVVAAPPSAATVSEPPARANSH